RRPTAPCCAPAVACSRLPALSGRGWNAAAALPRSGVLECTPSLITPPVLLVTPSAERSPAAALTFYTPGTLSSRHSATSTPSAFNGNVIGAFTTRPAACSSAAPLRIRCSRRRPVCRTTWWAAAAATATQDVGLIPRRWLCAASRQLTNVADDASLEH